MYETMLKLRKLLNICNLCAKGHSLVFKGSKSLCVIDGKYRNYIGLNEMFIAEINIFWVDEGVYLGIKLLENV